MPRTRRIRRFILTFLILTIITFVSIEFALAVFDPLGFVFYADLGMLERSVVHVESGWALPPGTHSFGRWQASVLPDTSRHVPHTMTTEDAADTLVFIGDSITFGWGVNDDQTFANLIAARLPSTYVINGGVPGYNSEQLRRRIQAFEDADRIIVLLFDNDPLIALPEDSKPSGAPSMSYTSLYVLYFSLFRSFQAQGDDVYFMNYARYVSDVRALAADPRVTLVVNRAFDPANRADDIAVGYGARVVYWTQVISAADAHPNAAGHRELSEQLLPIILD